LAFEILDSPLPFANLSPTRRLVALLCAAVALLALIWCGDVAYHAKPIEPKQAPPVDVQRTDLDRTGQNR
jgi:hypothetical protein